MARQGRARRWGQGRSDDGGSRGPTRVRAELLGVARIAAGRAAGLGAHGGESTLRVAGLACMAAERSSCSVHGGAAQQQQVAAGHRRLQRRLAFSFLSFNFLFLFSL
uniref:Uncharacterized protein n=1 Tax=Arundo donax TaxID=35708 RepID=A0A0A8XVB2_ARUDO